MITAHDYCEHGGAMIRDTISGLGPASRWRRWGSGPAPAFETLAESFEPDPEFADSRRGLPGSLDLARRDRPRKVLLAAAKRRRSREPSPARE